MGVVPKMPAVPPAAIAVAIVASIFASPCMAAGRPPPTPAADAGAGPKEPLVENLPASPAAQDFIRARCDQCSAGFPDYARMCYELLLPYATSINGSYNRAAIAGVAAMVSKLTFFAGKLQAGSPQLGECIQVVNETISGAKEALAKLGRLDAIGDDKVDAKNPDLVDVMKWNGGVLDNFAAKCRDDGGSYASAIAVTQDYLSTAYSIVVSPRPYWDNSLPSPDGSGP